MDLKLPKLKKINLNKEKKKKILLLSDDMRVHSGIGTMSKAIVLGTVHKYDWVQIGGAIKHPDDGKVMDLSGEAIEQTGVDDASVKIYPVTGYGSADHLRQVMSIEKPDAILHFTDPRFWQWLYQMEHEVRRNTPLMYYNIWDDLPYPHWNENAYESCDLLMGISKQTVNINRNVCQRKPRTDWDLTYVPHGVQDDQFFPITEDHKHFEEYTKFKKDVLGEDKYDFILMYNSRNIRRKSTSDLMLAFRIFCDSLPKEKAKRCTIILHTDPVDDAGTDLHAVADNIFNGHNVIFSNKKVDAKYLNFLYNLSSLGCNISSAEGFGLSCMEAIMSGTPVLVNCIGGLQDQVGLMKDDGTPVKLEDYTTDWPSNSDGRYKKHGEWSYVVWPQLNLQGSPMTPYIYDSNCDIRDVALQIKKAYENIEKLKDQGLAGREWAIENGFTSKGMCDEMIKSIEGCFKNWKPRKRYTLIDVNAPEPVYPDGILIKEI